MGAGGTRAHGARALHPNGLRFRLILRKVPGLSANPLGFRGGGWTNNQEKEARSSPSGSALGPMLACDVAQVLVPLGGRGLPVKSREIIVMAASLALWYICSRFGLCLYASTRLDNKHTLVSLASRRADTIIKVKSQQSHPLCSPHRESSFDSRCCPLVWSLSSSIREHPKSW